MQNYLLFLLIPIGVNGVCQTVNGNQCIQPIQWGNPRDPSHVVVFDKCLSYPYGGTGGTTPYCVIDQVMNQVEECKTDCPGAEAIDMTDSMNVKNLPGSCSCGFPNVDPHSRSHDNKIMDGKNANVGEFPWQVRLLTDRDVFDGFCGGALVGTRHVITAAHCTLDDEQKFKEDIFVLVGATDLSVEKEGYYYHNNKQDRTDTKRETRLNALMKNSWNDVAVLVLEKEVDLYSHPNIKPICLPFRYPTSTFYKKEAYLTGWGLIKPKTASGTVQPSNLRKVTVTVHEPDNEECKELKPDVICAGISGKLPNTEPHGGGGGDSGSPLVGRTPGFGTTLSREMVLLGVYKKSVIGSTDVYYQLEDDGWLSSSLFDGRTCGNQPLIYKVPKFGIRSIFKLFSPYLSGILQRLFQANAENQKIIADNQQIIKMLKAMKSKP